MKFLPDFKSRFSPRNVHRFPDMRILILAVLLFTSSPTVFSAPDTISSAKGFLNLFRGSPQSPYQLHWGVDLGIIGGGGALYLISDRIQPKYQEFTPDDLNRFSPDQVNAFDRWVTGPSNKDIDIASWLTNAGIVNYMWILFFGKEGRRDVTTILAMYAEAYFIYPLAQRFTQPLAARKRPYFYSDKEPVERRLGAMAQTSFVSGHTNYAFCFAVMTPILFSDYYPDSPWRTAVWSVSISTAVATAVLRVAGHYHFPTDVLAGAVTGSLIGWSIPFMHKKREGKNRIALTPRLYNDGSRGLSVTWSIPSNKR